MGSSTVYWVASQVGDLLRGELDGRCVITRQTFQAAVRAPNTVAFVDEVTIRHVGDLGHIVPIVLVLDAPLPRAVAHLRRYPWLQHVVSLNSIGEGGVRHLRRIVAKIARRRPPDLSTMVEGPLVGRAARLSRARQRMRRLERMGDFLESNGFRGRSAVTACDLAEEMLSNALYDAPVEAGAIPGPVSRLHEVILPKPCEVAYGISGGQAFVRVRDGFGSFKRERLCEVLTRCARQDMSVETDESRGGAGLGLWRIFSTAAMVSISVLGGRMTEVIVGVRQRAARGHGDYRPYAFHLYFEEAFVAAPADDELPELECSVTLLA